MFRAALEPTLFLDILFDPHSVLCFSSKINAVAVDTSQLDEFDYDETKNILFDKLKELSTKKFATEENYLESCRIMDNIAMTLLETE